MTRFFILSTILIVTLNNLSANNIQVSAPTLTGENRTEGYVYITFDLSWENSWRGTEANNWDAAWVFAKYRVGNGEWKHVKLHNNGHIAGSGTPATVDIGLRDDKQPFEPTGNPGVGVFMYRSAEGFGTFSTTGNKLRWNYTAEGITAGATVEVRVFAIEMVYVREGEFFLGGDGGFIQTLINTPDARVTPVGGGAPGGYPSGSYYSGYDIQPQFSDWPNGYNAFYCMKYESSQQQIVDFANTLVYSQIYSELGLSDLFTDFGSGSGRNMITYNGNSFSTSLPDVACGRMSSKACIAYADWACLRPMTELEFEKACRGPLPYVPGEYAWGTTTIPFGIAYSLAYEGTASENIFDNYSNLGNALYERTGYSYSPQNGDSYSGPFRVGIFSANGSNSGRVTSGASYWGIMELSGNVSESCVSLWEESGRSFRTFNGDGLLFSNGQYNGLEWPYASLKSRGGSFLSGYDQLRVSFTYPGQTIWGDSYNGFRAVRSPAQ
jgi:hypothetical protein